MILRADARDIPLADGRVQCVVTSPPYWGLRDYGLEGQIGLEPTPDAYVATMVDVFREVWRVLKDDGTVWLNLGDSYFGSQKTGGLKSISGHGKSQPWTVHKRESRDLKPKDLCGIPWRVAFALQADGWYLRSDIIWAKPNPMPESVTDRPTRSHEYIFLLTKSARYYYDADAIRDPTLSFNGFRGSAGDKSGANGDRNDGGRTKIENDYGGRNKRDVWTINSEPTPEAHFATFPQKIIEPCILAGSRMGDICFDPFLGSGTVGKVCERLGRRWVGLELSEDYIAIVRRRTAQQGLRLCGAAK